MNSKISRERLAPGCDMLSTTSPEEAQWNLQMCTPTLKEETIVESRDEEESTCIDNMYSSEPSDPSKFGIYYDSKDYVLEQLKMEFSDVEYPQSHYPSEHLEPSKFVNYYDNKDYALEQLKKELPEDNYPQLHKMELSMLRDGQKIKHENSEDGLSIIVKIENDSKMYQVNVKTERLEEEDILDNAEATSIHNDVLATSQIVHCNLCDRIFKNRFNLLKHNNGHIKVEINSLRDIEMNELKQWQYRNKVYDKSDNIVAHVPDVHIRKKIENKLCGKQLPFTQHPDGIIDDTNNDNLTDKELEEMKYKCVSCDRIYKSKMTLTMHIKRAHYDYGRTFECWCGKQFRTPIHLRLHMSRRHDGKTNDKLHRSNEDIKLCLTSEKDEEIKYKCDSCERAYKSKYSLTEHVKRIHYDYGRTFDCWCGIQFRTPTHLRLHMRRRHDSKISDTNNDKLHKSNNHNKLCVTDKEDEEMKYKCDSCESVYKSKYSLTEHVKRIHYDYGRMFECWCGKQFRTPMHLTEHKSNRHGAKNEVYKCEYCMAVFNVKPDLTKHIKRMHYDFGRTFDCWCGKQFRTPIHLRGHMKRQHGGTIKYVNNHESYSVSCSSTM